jgi:hypothetical protein
MSKITWEWLAGFTDGEGYIGVPGRGPVIVWGQKDKTVVDHLYAFLNEQGLHPHINFRKPKKELRRPNGIYICSVSRRTDVVKILDMLEPLMILKPIQCKKVRNWLKMNPPKQNYDDIDREKVKLWFEQGYSARWIAKQFNCERQKIYKFAKKYGIKIHPPGGKFNHGLRKNPMTKEEYRRYRNEKEKLSICPDCGIKIYRNSERCHSCATKYRHLTKPESFGTCNTKYVQSAVSQ